MPASNNRSVTPPDAPPALPPGDAPAPRITNHGNQEVELKIESIEHMGSNLDLDPSSLEPGYRYRWVYRAPVKVSRAKARGYAVVNPQTHPREIMNFVGDIIPPAEDGTITVGDVVLMRTKESHYRGRRKKMRAAAKARLEGPEKSFRGKAKEESQRAKLSRQVKVITDDVDPNQ